MDAPGVSRTYPYDEQLSAPTVSAEVARPWSPGVSVPVQLLVDSGAVVSGVPLTTLRQLGLFPLRSEQFTDFDGNLVVAPVFAVDLDIAGKEFSAVLVAGVKTGIGFAGRDLLDQFRVILDGPNRMMTLEAA